MRERRRAPLKTVRDGTPWVPPDPRKRCVGPVGVFRFACTAKCSREMQWSGPRTLLVEGKGWGMGNPGRDRRDEARGSVPY
jgi:hypothetical protein